MSIETMNENAVVNAVQVTLIEPEQLVVMLRELRQQIPEYAQLQVADTRALMAAASVDPALVESATGVTSESTVVRDAIGLTSEELRQESLDTVRWGAVEDELRMLLQGVASANRIRKHRVGLAALQAYNISRQLVRTKEHANLVPYVQKMRALIRAGRKSAAKADPATPVKQ